MLLSWQKHNEDLMLIIFIKSQDTPPCMSQQPLPGGQLLKEILDKYNWGFYPVIQPSSRMEPPTWDEIGRTEAQTLHMWESYLLLPRPKPKQTLAEAYTQFNSDGYFPVLTFPQQKRREDAMAKSGFYNQTHNYYFVTRIILKEKEAIAMSDLFASNP